MKPQIFTLQMRSESDGSVSWKLSRASVMHGHIDNPIVSIRIQGYGIETFLLPADLDPVLYFDSLLTARGVDAESVQMILESVK